jgi:HEAT repeat protein
VNASVVAKELIQDLLAEPSRFADAGRAHELLQAYFKGAPVDTLRPLLRSEDLRIRRAAAFVVSELGRQASPVLDDVTSLMNSGDRYLIFHAMESITVCATGEGAAEFLHVVMKLEDPDAVLRSLAMFLMSNADASQLGAAYDLMKGEPSDHQLGLELLMEPSATDESILALIASDKPLRRRYGAVAAARSYEKSPRLIETAAVSEDDDIGSFVKAFIRSRRGDRHVTV